MFRECYRHITLKIRLLHLFNYVSVKTMIVVNRRYCISKDWFIVAGYYEFAEGFYCCKELDFSKYWQCTNALIASRSRFTASLNDGPSPNKHFLSENGQIELQINDCVDPGSTPSYHYVQACNLLFKNK